MTLSALVLKRGIDSFTPEDFRFVTSKLADDPARLVLVGGQAIEVWGKYFNVVSPQGDHAPLTEDVDWLGGKRDAQWLCDKLGGPGDIELRFAGDFDVGPSSAQAYLKRGQRILMIDFLKSIVGPTSEAVRGLAVPVELVGGAVIQVMHPLLCLESRFGNLHILDSKRRGNGPIQARWSMDITKEFLRSLVAENGVAQTVKAIAEIESLAHSKAGRYCYIHFGLDAMECIPAEVVSAIGGKFETVDWPNRMRRIDEKHRRWADIAGRRIQHIPGS